MRKDIMGEQWIKMYAGKNWYRDELFGLFLGVCPLGLVICAMVYGLVKGF